MEQSQVQDQNLVQKPRENLIHFAALLFRTMADKYGCSTTLNELLMMNYGSVCHVNGKDFCVTKASADLDMAKSTASHQNFVALAAANGVVIHQRNFHMALAHFMREYE